MQVHIDVPESLQTAWPESLGPQDTAIARAKQRVREHFVKDQPQKVVVSLVGKYDACTSDPCAVWPIPTSGEENEPTYSVSLEGKLGLQCTIVVDELTSVRTKNMITNQHVPRSPMSPVLRQQRQPAQPPQHNGVQPTQIGQNYSPNGSTVAHVNGKAFDFDGVPLLCTEVSTAMKSRGGDAYQKAEVLRKRVEEAHQDVDKKIQAALDAEVELTKLEAELRVAEDHVRSHIPPRIITELMRRHLERIKPPTPEMPAEATLQ